MFMPSGPRIAEAMAEKGVDGARLSELTGIDPARVEDLTSGVGGRAPGVATTGEARAIALALGDGLSCRATFDGWALALVDWLEEAAATFGEDDYCYLVYFEAADCVVAFDAVDELDELDLAGYCVPGARSEQVPIGEALAIAREQIDPTFTFPDGSVFATPDVVGWRDLLSLAGWPGEGAGL